MIEFFIGGARSGKSSAAQKCAEATNKQLIYVATAVACDEEMKQRISHHQRDRDHRWMTIETASNGQTLVESIQEHNRSENCILIDCLTLWLSQILCGEDSVGLSQQAIMSRYELEKSQLIDFMEHCRCDLILVSNETGQGVVPANALSRQFVDLSGWLHQDIAKIANKVSYMVAGLPMVLKEKSLKERT